MSTGRKVITKNRKAQRDYLVKDRYDAGLVLLGSEIKSIRNHNINIGDGFVQEKEGELWLMNTHIAPYKEANIFGHTDPRRPRKLLLHRREINRIISKIRESGMTAIPLQVYLERGRAKVEIGIARGKRRYDKRADLAKRDAKRQIERALKER
jgi:SsrA-binding protein